MRIFMHFMHFYEFAIQLKKQLLFFFSIVTVTTLHFHKCIKKSCNLLIALLSEHYILERIKILRYIKLYPRILRNMNNWVTTFDKSQTLNFQSFCNFNAHVLPENESNMLKFPTNYSRHLQYLEIPANLLKFTNLNKWYLFPSFWRVWCRLTELQCFSREKFIFNRPSFVYRLDDLLRSTSRLKINFTDLY